MLGIDEDSFPRGGKKVSTGIKRKIEHDSLFPQEKRPKKTKKEKNPIDNVDYLNIASLDDSNGSLTISKLREGMIVLACIKKLSEHALDVELPGLLTAKVTIDAISDPLNIYLKNMLESSEITSTSELLGNLFKIGQYVPFKVESVVQVNEEKTNIFGSISPSNINHGRRHDSFRKGELMWCAVVSETDHGYQVDCGVSGCRIFLPSQNVNEGTELKIGQPIWCKVHKVDSEKTASTLRVGAKTQHIDTVYNEDTIPLNFILPGTKVEVFVEKILKHGIGCRVLDDFVGFIHETHLNEPLQKISTIKDSSTLKAYVLYIEETTRIVHLSLRSLKLEFEPTHLRGEKTNVTVLKKCPTGIYVKISKDEKGWISNKRLLNSLNENSKSLAAIREKYGTGSKHRCVVLGYNHMDRVYICSVEKELLNEKYFKYEDFKVGDLVEGTIKEIKQNGIVLLVGQVKGFVPNIHLTDSQYSENLKRKFIVGKKARARVFSVSENNVIFTLKSKFIRDGKCLKSLEEVEVNQIYPALVLRAKPFGIVLTFYNNIEGFVPMKEFDFPVTQEYKTNPSSYFHAGQVINVRISKIKPTSVLASLQLDAFKCNLNVGDFVNGIITSVEENGLKVIVNKLSEGFVPVEHLSVDESLCKSLLGTFKENDEISNLLVVKSNENGTILSRKDAIALKRSGCNVAKLSSIKKGDPLRCFVESIEHGGIFVSCLIIGFNKKVFVPNKFLSKDKDLYRSQQSLNGRVIGIDHQKELITLDLRLKSVFDYDSTKSVQFFTNYLADEEYLRKFGEENGSKLCEYDIGDKVTCLIKQLSDKGCLVELPNGCKGLVVKSLCGSYKKGVVQGIVLGHNYALEYVEICLNPQIMSQINSIQDGSYPKNETDFTVQKLLTRDQYILGVLIKNGNEQLIYMPLKLCENDLNNYCKSFYEAERFKIKICKKFDDKLIGFPKKLIHLFDQKSRTKNKLMVLTEITALSPIKKATSNGFTKSNSEENHSFPKVVINNTPGNLENSSDSGIHSRNYSNSSKEKSNNNNNSSENGVKVEERQEISETFCYEDNKSVLPSISNFFNATTTKVVESSSDDDEDDENKRLEGKRKKKKLTPAEKGEQTRLEEVRISKIEKDLADAAFEPKNAEQFERVLLAEPNSSALWIKYMSFYLSLAEFEKARNIGRKALETISMTLEDEKFNVWISLLNLENLYGTKETFEKTFDEAVQYNDAFKIYVKVLEMLHESGKYIELEEKIKKAKSKFKQEPEIWIRIAKIYYLLGKFENARNTKNTCLKSITSPKQQYSLIVKFGILEFSHGEIDIGVSIFENILDSYPSRVNAWIVYVDQLVSKNLLEEARAVLNRAIMMKLPLKATKVIYHKFRSFEEKYGTPETLNLFKDKAKRVLQEKVQHTT